MFKNDDEHREHVVDEIGEYINEKYLKGQKAHGGHLWRKNLTPHAIEEAADLCVYLFTKREQEQRLVISLEALIAHIRDIGRLTNSREHALRIAEEILNTITIGNPEGIEEEEHEKSL